jgi:aminoglycoside/choline kinase family phosphotransferase
VETADDRTISLYERVLEQLLQLQIEGVQGFDPAWCCQTVKYDRRVMRRFESDYFRDAFLRDYLGQEKEWPELATPFELLAEKASGASPEFFMHRDFQSRNIMVSGENVGILDWQGGRFGPLEYDFASLIIDPYVNLSSELRLEIYRRSLSLIKAHKPSLVEPFERHFPYLAIQRNLQILGAFAFLTRVRRRRHFKNYIPAALDSLRTLLEQLNEAQFRTLLEVVRMAQNLVGSIRSC